MLRALHGIMRDETLTEFHLGGGTSLALRLGHRRSIDIDLFTLQAFEVMEMASRMGEFHGLREVETATNTVRGVIDGVRIDCLAHRYPLIGEVVTVGEIRFLSFEDLAAMKLNAIVNRGSKKDFWDLAILLERFSPEDLFDLYAKKYQRDNLWMVEKSILYFDEAEGQPDPEDLGGRSWQQIKSFLRTTIRL